MSQQKQQFKVGDEVLIDSFIYLPIDSTKQRIAKINHYYADSNMYELYFEGSFLCNLPPSEFRKLTKLERALQ